MKYVAAVFQFFYGDTLKYLGFLFAVTFVATGALIFLAYPLQTVLTVVALFVTYVVFLFFHEFDA